MSSLFVSPPSEKTVGNLTYLSGLTGTALGDFKTVSDVVATPDSLVNQFGARLRRKESREPLVKFVYENVKFCKRLVF